MKTAVYFEHNFPTWKTMILGAFLGISVASCADQNFDWEEAKSQNPEYTFRTNFESLVGTIDPNQSWDLSSNEATLGTRAIETIKTEKVAGLDFKITNSYSNSKIQSSFGQNEPFYDAVTAVLPDKVEKKGSTVVLVAPENGFYIYPISAQGQYTYRLYVKVGNENAVEVFNKNWSNADKAYCNGMAYATSGSGSSRKYTTCSMGGLYVEAPIGTAVSIYITVGATNRGTSTGNAIYVTPASVGLPEGLPSNIPSDAEIRFVGIEDQSFGDKDFNDLALAIIGVPKVPEEVIIREDEYDATSYIKKRYMVEDLGSTAKTDIDFNDFVVDMVEKTVAHHKITKENGVIKTDEVTGTNVTQTAQVRAMGGTLDFLFMLTREEGGVTKYKPIYKKSDNVTDVTEMIYTAPDDIALGYDNLKVGDPFTITGWNPAANNVAFYVSREEIDIEVDGSDKNIDKNETSLSGDLYQSFVPATGATAPYRFPNPGDVPFIIAFDITKNWRQERQKICSHWITGSLNGNDECDDCGEDGTNYGN